jgi:hypothetical protein
MSWKKHVGGEINTKFKPQNPEGKDCTIDTGVHRMRAIG